MVTEGSGSHPLQSHQMWGDPVAKGNPDTDAVTTQAARGQLLDKPKVLLALKISVAPRYSPEEEECIKKEGGTKAKTGWWIMKHH